MIDASIVQSVTQFGGIGVAGVMLAFFLKEWKSLQERIDRREEEYKAERAELLKKIQDRDDKCFEKFEQWRKVIEDLVDEIRRMQIK